MWADKSLGQVGSNVSCKHVDRMQIVGSGAASDRVVKKSASSSLRIPGVIARDLGVKIVSGMLRPGSVLEGEVEASDQRKVSRSAYREAVRIHLALGKGGGCAWFGHVDVHGDVP